MTDYGSYIEQQIKELAEKIQQTHSLLSDPDLKDMAQEEIKSLEAKKSELEKSIAASDEADIQSFNAHNVMVEIRAAAGGEEAGLFAADLYRMYQKYAASKNWKFRQLSLSEGGIGNMKQAVAEISGKDAFEKLRFESGVHRVQRIPKTESSGRIHTSTATVAVLAKVESTQVDLDPKDLKIDTFRASCHGGQNVQKVSTAVRITHIPTGMVVICQDERSQLQNKTKALEILRARLYFEMEEQKKEKVDELRADQIGRGERSEKIRTYNFPQDRVTDHRLKKSWGNLDKIMDGNLDKLLENSKE